MSRSLTRLSLLLLFLFFFLSAVRQQLATGPRLSLVQHARLLLAEGPLSLYRGIGPVVSTIVPKVAVRFAAFHGISSIVSGGDDKTSFLGNLAAGMGAGVVEALLVVTPSEVVKVRMQDVAASARCTQLQMLRRVLQESGLRGLYRGCFATTLRQAGQQGCKFAFFYQFRDRLAALGLGPGSTSDVIAGALANSVGAVMNTPLDVVKSRIQRQSAGETKYNGLLRSFVIVYREEGIGALSKGLTARLWRIAPAGAVQFFVFEKVKKLLTCFVLP